MPRLLSFLTVASLLLGSFQVGCSPKDGMKKVPRFAFVINVSGRYWEIAFAGCLQAAKEEGVDVDLFIPGESTAAEQIQIIDTLMSRGFAGMAITPLNPESMTRVLDRATEHMLVICMDSDAPDSQRVCYIGTDNFALGKTMGEALKAELPEGGEVAVFGGQLDVGNSKGRLDGVKAALAGDKYKIVEVLTDQGDRPTAKSNAADALSKYPNLKGMVGLWGYNGHQAANAAADIPGRDVKIVGCDEDIETIYAVRKDQLVCSIAQQPYAFGYQSIKMLAKLHKGEQVSIPEDKIIYIPTYRIDKTTADTTEKFVEEKLAQRERLLSRDWLKK